MTKELLKELRRGVASLDSGDLIALFAPMSQLSPRVKPETCDTKFGSRGKAGKSMKKHLTSRLRYLRNFELSLAVLLPLAFVWLWSTKDSVNWWLRLGAMGLVSFLLLQGGTYWHLKLVALLQRTPLPAQAVRGYRLLRVVNIVALTAGFVSVTFALTSPVVTIQDALWGYGVLGFATLEYINYYFVQLAHDNLRDLNHLLRHTRLRKAPLADDIDRRARA